MSEYLAQFVTDERKRKIADVLSRRISNVIPVLDGISDFGNRDAVFRTAEALGYYEIHWVRPQVESERTSNRSAQGAEKWLDIKSWREPRECIANLRERGYRIWATHLSSEARGLDTLVLGADEKIAVVLGNEHSGVSQEFLDAADGVFMIPLVGFTQSLNISVAAGICLWEIRNRLSSFGLESAVESHAVLEYYRKSAAHSDALVRHFEARNAP